MNRISIIPALLIALGVPVFSTGEGSIEKVLDSGRLPVTNVSLYTAGLAWMVHETSVTDNEVLFFSVEQSDINDILKSLIVEDLGGGTIDSITFDSENPLATALSDLRVNPSGSPALVDFLGRTQGEPVSVTTAQGIFSGRIFSVEVLENENSRQVLLNLMDVEGIKTIDITQMQNLQFQDLILQNELLSALDLISRSRVKSSRMLKLSFKGTGKRTVQLSYIRSVPLWKTSYRITLDEEGVPRLEGWALVQNTGNQDWENVTLSFVAGQPNAFTMDLATPRYVYRTEVQRAAAVPLGPTEYDRSYGSSVAPSLKMAEPSVSYSERKMSLEDESVFSERSYVPEAVVPQATGSRAGNFYRYTVQQPVIVDARSSAMIPILSQSDVGDSLAVFDPTYDLVFKGIRLHNDSEAHWAAGPATITEGRYYGGDALIPEMIPGADRLITYAVHGSVEVEKLVENEPQRLESLRIVDGLLYRTDKILRKTVYTIEGDEKELLLIHKKERGWTLTEHPEIGEETAGEYRFTLKEWGNPVPVSEEYIVSQQLSLNSLRRNDINYYMQWGEFSRDMKNAFQEISALLQHIESIGSENNLLNSKVSQLERDQNRVRENMSVLDRDSSLYKQYSDQLATQERDIQQYNKEIIDGQDNLASADKKLKDYIRELDID